MNTNDPWDASNRIGGQRRMKRPHSPDNSGSLPQQQLLEPHGSPWRAFKRLRVSPYKAQASHLAAPQVPEGWAGQAPSLPSIVRQQQQHATLEFPPIRSVSFECSSSASSHSRNSSPLQQSQAETTSYAPVNSVLGQLHELRRKRDEEHHRRQADRQHQEVYHQQQQQQAYHRHQQHEQTRQREQRQAYDQEQARQQQLLHHPRLQQEQAYQQHRQLMFQQQQQVMDGSTQSIPPSHQHINISSYMYNTIKPTNRPRKVNLRTSSKLG